jgi:hypothetical protein
MSHGSHVFVILIETKDLCSLPGIIDGSEFEQEYASANKLFISADARG